MGASESKTDDIDVEVDVAEAPVLVKGTHLFAFPPGSGKGSTPKFAVCARVKSSVRADGVEGDEGAAQVPLADLAAEVESDPHKVLIYKKMRGAVSNPSD